MAVLNNSAAEDLGDQDELEAALEAELAAAEEEEGEGGAAPTPTPASAKKKKASMGGWAGRGSQPRWLARLPADAQPGAIGHLDGRRLRPEGSGAARPLPTAPQHLLRPALSTPSACRPSARARPTWRMKQR